MKHGLVSKYHALNAGLVGAWTATHAANRILMVVPWTKDNRRLWRRYHWRHRHQPRVIITFNVEPAVASLRKLTAAFAQLGEAFRGAEQRLLARPFTSPEPPDVPVAVGVPLPSDEAP